jgi:hypothetical protein
MLSSFVGLRRRDRDALAKNGEEVKQMFPSVKFTLFGESDSCSFRLPCVTLPHTSSTC